MLVCWLVKDSSPRILISAGPTYEDLDRVRFIGNRSSGKLGVAIASASLSRGWDTTLLLGPVPNNTEIDLIEHDPQGRLLRFRSAIELDELLDRELADHDVLIMAAAVADYRPSLGLVSDSKLERKAEGITLRLEAVPDLLRKHAARRRNGQVFIGFALEARDKMLERGREKLVRKGLDAIVANPLETIDSSIIEGTVIASPEGRPGTVGGDEIPLGSMDKSEFAQRLLDFVRERRHAGIK